MKSLIVIILAVFAFLPFTPAATEATSIECKPQPADPPGDCSGDMSYAASDATHATLTFTLNNDSDPTFGGFITAFIFNNPDNRITQITGLTVAPPDYIFNFLLANDTVNGSPFGSFDILVTIASPPKASSGFEGGGSPSGGIAAGDSATFTLALLGNNLNEAGFTDANFRNTFSINNNSGIPNIWGAVRYRGFSADAPGGTSDKDELAAVANPVPQREVPAPMSLVLLGSGVLGLGVLARKKLAR
jgi:hypothetical protein